MNRSDNKENYSNLCFIISNNLPVFTSMSISNYVIEEPHNKGKYFPQYQGHLIFFWWLVEHTLIL